MPRAKKSFTLAVRSAPLREEAALADHALPRIPLSEEKENDDGDVKSDYVFAYPAPFEWDAETMFTTTTIRTAYGGSVKDANKSLTRGRIQARFQVPVEDLILDHLRPKNSRWGLTMLRALCKLVWLCEDVRELNSTIRKASDGKRMKVKHVLAAHNSLRRKGREYAMPG